MEQIKNRKCGYCGIEKSMVISHGKELQNAWVKDEQYGWLCKLCANRKRRTGTPIRIKDRLSSERNEFVRTANLKLYGTEWQCTDAVAHKDQKDGMYYTSSYIFICKHCGNKVKWNGTVEDFLSNRKGICRCVALNFMFDKGLVPKNEKAFTKIAKAIIDNPESSMADIARNLGLSRQRIEQVIKRAKTMYIVYRKGVECHGQNQDE